MIDVEGVRGMCAGFSAVVVGAGPSIRALRTDSKMTIIDGLSVPDVSDDDPMRKHVIIAVNDAILKFPDCDFYITADGKMIYNRHWEVLRNSTCYAALPSYSFNPGNVENMGVSKSRAILFDRGKPNDNVDMSKSTNEFHTQSSAMAGVQLAVILGCNPIYMIGCEGECKDDRKYFWEFPGQPGPGGTKAGYKTIWQQVHSSRGEHVEIGQYDETFDVRKGGADSKTILAWASLIRANQGVNLVNVTGKLKSSGMKTCTVEQMLERGNLHLPRKTGTEYWTRNYDLSKIRNAHAGRSALVMGSGPSLRYLGDRNRLVPWTCGNTRFMLPDTTQRDRAKNHVTISVNEAILKVPDSDYYITGDARMPNCVHWLVVVSGSDCRVLMPSFGLARENYYRGGITPNRLFMYQRRDNAADWRVSCNSETLLGELNSMQAGVNLAVILGCTPIYVIGCEQRLECERKYFWEFAGQPGPGGTSTGHKTIWQQTQDSYGRLKNDKQYDAVFDLHAGKITGAPGIRKWKRFAKINPSLDIRDVCNSEWNRGYYRKVSVEEMLSDAK